MKKKSFSLVRQAVLFFLVGLFSVGAGATSGLASQEAELLLARGNKLYLDGDYGAAQRDLRQAATLDPGNPEIRVLLGLSYFVTEAYPEAEAEFAEAVRLDPTVPRGKLYLGVTAFYLGKFQQAERWLKEAHILNPKDPLVLYYLSLIASHRQLPQEARQRFHEAVALGPEYQVPFQQYQRRLSRTQRYSPEKPFSVEFSTGIEYDDNFKILPDQINLPFNGRYPGAKGSWRVPIVLTVGYRPILQDQWVAGVDYSFYSGNNFTIDNFNFLTNRAELFARYRQGEFSLQPWYAIDVALKALERYSLFNSAGLTASWQHSELLNLDLIYQFQNRSFRYRVVPAYKRSGTLNEVGLFQTFLFGRRAAWRLGGLFGRELTEGVNWDNKSFSFLTDATVTLPYRLNFWACFQYSRLNFDNTDTFAGVRQHQNYYQVSLQLRHSLTSYLDVIAGYTHVSQRSNIPDFTYDRNIYQLLLAARY
ncbi:MAG: tetratricopeptide repeat protein [Desulfobacca sp.]|uniref:tetratricopeptide repeat protein n=1 Tax=Desulfobacca sp. TaxID=2067990 RepID=UPI004049D5BE